MCVFVKKINKYPRSASPITFGKIKDENASCESFFLPLCFMKILLYLSFERLTIACVFHQWEKCAFDISRHSHMTDHTFSQWEWIECDNVVCFLFSLIRLIKTKNNQLSLWPQK